MLKIIATCFEVKCEKHFIHKNLSSTRKMQEFHMANAGSKCFFLWSLPECLSNNSLFWNTGNFAATKIAESGNSKPELLTKVVKIFERLEMNERQEITWVCQEKNGNNDFINKLIHCNDIIQKFYLQAYCRKMGVLLCIT